MKNAVHRKPPVLNFLRVAVAITLAVLLSSLLLQIAQAADQTAMLGGDPARSGVQPGPAPTGDLTATTLADQTGYSSLEPVILGSTLYRMVALPATSAAESAGRAIEAINLASGTSLWTKPLPDGLGNPNTGLAIMNDLLFYVSSTHDQTTGESDSLVAFNIADGTATWSVPVGRRSGAYSGSPVVKNGVVYWVDLDGTAYAVIADTGKVVWTSTGAKAVKSPFADDNLNISGVVSSVQFALDDHQLYLSNSDGDLAALKLSDGALTWSFNVAQRFGVTVNSIDPRVYDGGVFLSISAIDPSDATHASFSLIASLKPTTGGVAWKQFLPQNSTGGSVVNGLAILSFYRAGSDGQDVVAYDLTSGKTVWSYASRYIGAADAGIAVVGDAAYVTGTGGFVIQLGLHDGKAAVRYEFPDPVVPAQSMFISGGRIALVGANGALVILATK